MVTLGTDSHKSSHTVVAVDGNGREVGRKTFRANGVGHLEALRWANQWEVRNWALEDCRQLSRRLESDLLVAGEVVLRVSPKLMATARRGGREPGKSDPIDALAVARAALREPALPKAHLDQPTREVRLLVDHREDLVQERTRTQNRLRWHLHELDPEYELAAGALSSMRTLSAVEDHLAAHAGLVMELALELVGRIRDLVVRINELERQIAARTSTLSPQLMGLFGCGALTAGKIVGETAGGRRFRSPAAFAMHTGTAPIPVWSGNTERYRLNRGGNRQLNAALHRIAITQLQRPGRAREYIAKRISSGDSRSGAIRALRRHLADEVYRRLLADEDARFLKHVQLAPVA